MPFEGRNRYERLAKERIALLRAEGKSYTKIADTLGLSINTVKSYCRRNNLGGNATIMSDSVIGTFAAVRVPLVDHREEARFCSTNAAWRGGMPPEDVNHKTIRSLPVRCGRF